jgi:hypothetical protein
MSQNIWNATLEPNNNVKQNTFDWTHVNNLTTQIGRITPIQCELVPAKTSFRVKPFPALQLMPMVFPIQTRMRATISYFRYPLRALWKDFKDFEGNFREGLEEPYHDFNSQSMLDKMLGTGKLMDYLGVPTTLVGLFGNDIGSSFSFLRKNDNGFIPFGLSLPDFDLSTELYTYQISLLDGKKLSDFTTLSLSVSGVTTRILGAAYAFVDSLQAVDDVYHFSINVGQVTSENEMHFSQNSGLLFFDSSDNYIGAVLSPSYSNGSLTFVQSKTSLDLSSAHRVVFIAKAFDAGSGSGYETYPLFVQDSQAEFHFLYPFDSFNYNSYSQSVSDVNMSNSPYFNSNSVNKNKQIKLSAYAARAYEGIYNSVYRDNRNNPYYINGVVQYNQWIPSYEGGADSYPYELRYANWEKDFLTTAVQSPQQGNAPLVGITTYEQSSVVANESGEPTTVKQTKVAMVDEEGKRYSLEFESDSDELKDVKYVELDNGTTVRSARSLFDLVTSGISITDLRNVNAYQKFLELNMRKGYSYKEIIEGRFDVKVRYADLLLPEFFGGFSRDINMNAITQTVDKDDANTGSYKDALGSQAGVGYFRGGTDANIECFCDEESIIMGLLVITPLPVYTQLLPKHFLYRGLLDHFNPEFNNISFQPITYKEVCPIQAYNENPDLLTDTFGYQRAWYEYCQRYDQAHGLFRTDLSNFLMHRVFNQKPELAQSFLIVDPDQVTDVFSVTETTDKVYGQILLDCTVKLPVARVAIPRLD